MKPEDYSRRQQEITGWSVIIETYKLGDIYHCTIASADPGARFARADITFNAIRLNALRASENGRLLSSTKAGSVLANDSMQLLRGLFSIRVRTLGATSPREAWETCGMPTGLFESSSCSPALC